jgi:subtilisin family serine protease
MRASELFEKSFGNRHNKTNSLYKSRDFLYIFATLFLLLAVPLTVLVVLQVRDVRKQASSPDSGEIVVKRNNIEFVSNEILVKLKKGSLAKVKSKPKPLDTGIGSLNNLNKKQKASKFQRLSQPHKKTKNKNHPVFRWYKVTLPGKREVLKKGAGEGFSSQSDQKFDELNSILKEYKKDTNLEEAQLNYIVHTTSLPNDTYVDPDQNGTWSTGAWGQSYEDLWGLKKIRTDSAWDEATGRAQVKIAVIDTGLDYNHEDIKDSILINKGEIPNNFADDDGNGYVDDVYGASFVGGDTTNDPVDTDGHGTHVAGTIAAVGNNSKGIIGVAPEVKIMPIKGVGYFLTSVGSVYQSIIYAVDNEADVINNSWGICYDYCPSVPVIEDAVRYAFSQDIVLVFSAGNEFHANVADFSPKNMQEVITVSAFDQNDNILDFSNIGAGIDVAAPGVDILSLKSESNALCDGLRARTIGTNYCLAKGTSMAAPHVSGLAALIRAENPNFSNEYVKQLIQTSSDDVGSLGEDVYSGSGRVNVAKAKSTELVFDVISPDVDNNGFVSGLDFFAVIGGFGKEKGQEGYKSWLDLDGDGYIAGQDIFLAIGSFNLSWPPNNLQEERLYRFFVKGESSSGDDTLVYSMAGLPGNATLNSSTGDFRWKPTATQSGNYYVKFEAVDSNNNRVSKALRLKVLNTQ